MKNLKILKNYFIFLAVNLLILLSIPVNVFAEETTAPEVETYSDGTLTYCYVDGGVAVYACETGMLAVNILAIMFVWL